MSPLTVLLIVGLCGKLCFCLNLTNHGDDVAHLKQLVQQLNTSLHQMAMNNRNEINQLKANFNTQSQGSIAFTATLTHNTEYLAGNTVVFDRIILNLGNAYHESYGHFTVPVRGVHQFSASLLNNGKDSYFNIMRNGNQMLSDIYTKTGYISSSSIVVVQLEARDVVFVKASTTGNLDGGYYCIFSGFLIK
ncbi:complement C1q-like protein 4 isoform X1 [Saccostrea cucullata]|uniref:complement C1q-like protein 4 isoform X1 n=1 Tax=Saccostrea cuccullata TaxID=36930 RepID=UPI002ED0B7FA